LVCCALSCLLLLLLLLLLLDLFFFLISFSNTFLSGGPFSLFSPLHCECVMRDALLCCAYLLARSLSPSLPPSLPPLPRVSRNFIIQHDLVHITYPHRVLLPPSLPPSLLPYFPPSCFVTKTKERARRKVCAVLLSIN
jgi:hypothetical protein